MRAALAMVMLLVILLGNETQGQPGAPAPAPAPAPLSPPQNTTAPLVVCGGSYAPFVMCNETEPTSTYTGFSVELYRRAAEENDLIENVDYVLKCTTFTTSVNELKSVNGTCDVGIGAITITSDRQDEGIQFAYPIYSTGLGIMVQGSNTPSGGWAWVQPFSYELWLAVGLTVVIFPALLFVIEFGSLKRRIHLQDAIRGLDIATTRALETIISNEPLVVSSSGAKVASLVFLFMAMILVNTYTANLAAFLTVNQINSQITSVEQLRGKAVASNPVYLEKLRSRYGILAIELDDDDPDALFDAARLIKNGELTAVMTDSPLLEAALQSIPGCEVRRLSDALIEPFNYGFGVRNGIDQKVVDKLSEALLIMQEDGDLQDLAESFLGFNSRDDCGNLQSENYSIGFYSLYGLWVLLGIAVAIGFILMMISRLHRKKKLERKRSRRNGLGGGSNGVNPMPQRRDLITLGGISEEAEESDRKEQRQKQQQDEVETVGSVSKNRPTATAAGKWREVVHSMSALQTSESIFRPTASWHSRDDIELQQTIEESSDEE